MTDEQIALARRAVACKGWRWMPGMLTSENLRVVSVSEEHRYAHVHPGSLLLPTQGYALPDLTDPATLGCLLALVREAWGEFGLVPCLFKEPGEWNVYLPNSDFAVGETEAETLVAALEAAP